MRIRTSVAGEPSFQLKADVMVENDDYMKYWLYRGDLRRALKQNGTRVRYYYSFAGGQEHSYGWIREGNTQRGKKFIEIGCKRFVGENRTKLIRWAKSGK